MFLTTNQKGNVTIITLLMVSIASIIFLLPMVQGSMVTLNNTISAINRTATLATVESAITYSTKAFLTTSIVEDETNKTFDNKTYNLSPVFDRTVRVHFARTMESRNRGKLQFEVISEDPAGRKVTRTRTFRFFDMALTPIYTLGYVHDVVAGEFRYVVSGGRQSWYIEENPDLIVDASKGAFAFPKFKDPDIIYEGDTRLTRWNYSAYRKVNNGAWVVPFKFTGQSNTLPQILEADNGVVIKMDPDPTLPQTQWVNFFARKVLVDNVYRDDYWGPLVFVNTKPEDFTISFPDPWEFNLRYYPQTNNSTSRPFFSKNFITDRIEFNFGVLYGSIISRGDIVSDTGFRTYTPVSGNPNHWMRGNDGTMWALVEQSGLWFCISESQSMNLYRKLKEYTANGGSKLIISLVRP